MTFPVNRVETTSYSSMMQPNIAGQLAQLTMNDLTELIMTRLTEIIRNMDIKRIQL